MRNTERGVNCDRCGWIYGPHICVDLTKKVEGEGQLTVLKPKKAMSEERKKTHSEAALLMWARRRGEL